MTTYTRAQADVAQRALTQLLETLHGSGLTPDDVAAFHVASDAVVLAREYEPASKAAELDAARDVVLAMQDTDLDNYGDLIETQYESAAAWLPLLVDPTA